MKTYFKARTIHKPLLFLGVGISMLAPAHVARALAPTPIPGAMCQAYDEAALKSGELIRTTIGIENKSDHTIKVYCPVDTDTSKKRLNVILIYTSNAPRFKTGTDTYGLPALKCWAGYGSKPTYRKFTHSGLGQNSVTLPTNKFTQDPVTVKCTLKPGEQIKGIFSK